MNFWQEKQKIMPDKKEIKEATWIFALKEKVPQFLEKLKGKRIPGFFHYSLSGDLYHESIKWGLGNTVFAAKIYYTLDLLDKLPEKDRKNMANFIKGFQKEGGTIYDPLVKRKAFLREKLSAIENLDFNNFFHHQTIRAETRQAISALKLLGKTPGLPYQKFPKTRKEIRKYLEKLDWQRPWRAGSHFSHLIFFLKNSNLENKEDLINFAIDWVAKLQNSADGSWYQGSPSLQQKINGAMKIITGLKVAGKINFEYPKELIDLCLSARNNKLHACNDFNIIYTLHYSSKVAKNGYRLNTIKDFVLEHLKKTYKQHYFPEIGGFSFFVGKANTDYYGAKITRGLNEPDIHGTVMFLWGISIAAQILRINDDLGFKELIS